MSKLSKFETERLNVNMPKALMEKVNKYAIENGLPKTQAIVQLLNKALEQDIALETLKKALVVIEKNQSQTIDGDVPSVL